MNVAVEPVHETHGVLCPQSEQPDLSRIYVHSVQCCLTSAGHAGDGLRHQYCIISAAALLTRMSWCRLQLAGERSSQMCTGYPFIYNSNTGCYSGTGTSQLDAKRSDMQVTS